MIDAESGCVICFNGEVYNFLELRKELEAEGVRFDSHCDTEVILKAYVRRGEDCWRSCAHVRDRDLGPAQCARCC